MGRAVIFERFGGPEVLEVKDISEPHAGAGEVRVKVTFADLNPMDPAIISMPQLAERFGITPPAGFGSDFAGVVDEVGEGVSDFSVGDRVYGGAIARSIADFVVVQPGGILWHTPDGVSDEIASTLTVAGRTAVAALEAIDIHEGDTVLIGGAAGGVGIFAIQLAKLAGARVIGTASEGTFDFLRDLGVEPVAYGEGLADRVKELAPDGITAAADLFGTETAEAALKLGVSPDRISTVAAQANVSQAVRATGAIDAKPDALTQVTDALIDGKLTVPIEATYPIEQIHDAVTLLAKRHAHGKIIIRL